MLTRQGLRRKPMWEAVFFLLFGVGGSVAAVWYKMRRMEKQGEFDRQPGDRW